MMLDPVLYQKSLRQTADFLQAEVGNAPPTALILGSGLGDFVEDLPNRAILDYAAIPGFPVSTVVGHSGRLVVAESGSNPFCCLQGRAHVYEGLAASVVVFPVRALALWGVRSFIITNAAGAINTGYSPGDLMLITDHINLLGVNPLAGTNLDELGVRFPDMTHAYDPALQKLALDRAGALNIPLQSGVYAAVQGPSYETPAEIRMMRTLGADAVGMSTVPEVIALNHMDRQVLGLSCITNMAAGILPERMRHEEVLETATRVRDRFSRLLLSLVNALVLDQTPPE